EEVRAAALKRNLRERVGIILIALTAARNARQRITTIDRMKVISAGLLAHELHVHQAAEHRAAVYALQIRLQQIVHCDGCYRTAVDRERLDNALRGDVQAAEGFAYEFLDNVFGKHAIGVIQDLAQGDIPIRRQDREQRFK